MSKEARRKNRRSGKKKGFRREAGRTPRYRVRELRDRPTNRIAKTFGYDEVQTS